MITAVDTNVLLDVFVGDPTFGPRSAEALRRCIAEGQIVACEVVWAEVSAAFASASRALESLARLGVQIEPVGRYEATAAGAAWRRYRNEGGPRSRIVADFLVGAHADARADRLLTRDRGFYRTRFRRLRVLDPTED